MRKVDLQNRSQAAIYANKKMPGSPGFLSKRGTAIMHLRLIA